MKREREKEREKPLISGIDCQEFSSEGTGGGVRSFLLR